MKKMNVLLILMVICIVPISSFAQEPDRPFGEKYAIGVGVMAGEPNSLTAKYNLDATKSIVGGFGWTLSDDNDFHVYGDLIYHVYDLVQLPEGKLPVYVGGGIRFLSRHKKDEELGVRVPVGTEYQFDKLHIGAFIELVPVVKLTPEMGLDFEGGIGIRYFF